MEIRRENLFGPEIIRLLSDHLSQMRTLSPPESVHALDVNELQAPNITFWSVWEENSLLGCGALKALDKEHGEVKSMRTAPEHRGRGVGKFVLSYIVAEARRRDYRSLALETGSRPEFAPARGLYEQFGFTYCGPFSDYVEDSNSVFMRLWLAARSAKVGTWAD